MRRLFFLLSLFLAILFSSEVFGFGGCEKKCQRCHTLDRTEIQQIFRKIDDPDAKVLDINMSPVKGLWEVVIESRGSRGVMYVGFDKKFIMGGPVFEIDTSLNKTEETLSKINRMIKGYADRSRIPLANAIVMGDIDAQHRVIVFTDPDCLFCGKLHNELKKVVSERQDIAFYIKLMPQEIHPDAYLKSRSIVCSGSLEMLEENFAMKPIPEPDCETDEIDENIKLGAELGITVTPALILPDGLVVIGAEDAAMIIELVLNSSVKPSEDEGVKRLKEEDNRIPGESENWE